MTNHDVNRSDSAFDEPDNIYKRRLRNAINALIQSRFYNQSEALEIITRCGIASDHPIVKQLVNELKP